MNFFMKADVVSSFDWFVMMDDDTYMIPSKLESWLDNNWALKHNEPIAMGREFTRAFENSSETLIGGGPGILISRAAISKSHLALSLVH